MKMDKLEEESLVNVSSTVDANFLYSSNDLTINVIARSHADCLIA